jgi:hypothetical protein
VFVTAGNTDGILTEVRGDSLTEGMEVITGEETAEEAAARNTNPFGPPQWGRPGGGSSRRSGGM